MNETGKTRYFIKGECLVSKEPGEENVYYLFMEGKWKPGVLVVGFLSLDDEDPDGTVVSAGSLDSLVGFNEISEDEARDVVIIQTLDYLRNKWETRFPDADTEIIQKYVEADLGKYGIRVVDDSDIVSGGDDI